jgi:hypothetical protein
MHVPADMFVFFLGFFFFGFWGWGQSPKGALYYGEPDMQDFPPAHKTMAIKGIQLVRGSGNKRWKQLSRKKI